MKKFLMMFGAVGLLAGMLMLSGCGDDSKANTGKLVKGLVSGEVVKDTAGTTLTGTTGTGIDGLFTLGGNGSYVSSGLGKYTPLTATGAAGTAVFAPVMKLSGGSIMSPLSTLVYNDTTGKVLANLKLLGIDLNTDLSVKTATNANAMIYNEAVGAILQATGGTDATVIAALVANLSATLPTTLSATTIAAGVVGTNLTAYSAAVTTAATGASALAVGASLPAAPTPPTTLATGTGSSATTVK
jgi:hypothetical protein